MNNRRKFFKSLGLLSATALVGGLHPKNSLAKTKIKWKMVTSWPKNFPGLGAGAETLARYINNLSGGSLEVKVFGANELVPPLGVFDFVSSGGAEMGHSGAYYWKGKTEAAQFFFVSAIWHDCARDELMVILRRWHKTVGRSL